MWHRVVGHLGAPVQSGDVVCWLFVCRLLGTCGESSTKLTRYNVLTAWHVRAMARKMARVHHLNINCPIPLFFGPLTIVRSTNLQAQCVSTNAGTYLTCSSGGARLQFIKVLGFFKYTNRTNMVLGFRHIVCLFSSLYTLAFGCCVCRQRACHHIHCEIRAVGDVALS